MAWPCVRLSMRAVCACCVCTVAIGPCTVSIGPCMVSSCACTVSIGPCMLSSCACMLSGCPCTVSACPYTLSSCPYMLSGSVSTLSDCVQTPCTALWRQPETGCSGAGAAAGPAEPLPGCRRGGRALHWGLCSHPMCSAPGWGSGVAALQHQGPVLLPCIPRGCRWDIAQPREHPASSPTERLSPLFPFISALFIPPPCAALAGAGVPGAGVPAPRVGWAVLQRGLEADAPNKDAALPLFFFFFF